MTDELKDRKSYSPYPEDRHRTIEEKVRGNGLALAPDDVADQTIAKQSGALDRPAQQRDPLDDDFVGGNPPDQAQRLLDEVKDAQIKRDAEGQFARSEADSENNRMVSAEPRVLSEHAQAHTTDQEDAFGRDADLNKTTPESGPLTRE